MGKTLRNLVLCGMMAIGSSVAPYNAYSQDSPPAVQSDSIPKKQKPAIPSNADIQKAEKDIKEVYNKEYQLGDPVKRQEFGTKLLDLASQMKPGDEPAKYVLLRDAAVYGSLDTAFTAVNEMDKIFDVDKVGLKAGALGNARKSAKTKDDLEAIADKYCTVLDEVINEEYAQYAENLTYEAPMAGASFSIQNEHSKRAAGLVADLKKIAPTTGHASKVANYEKQIRQLETECNSVAKALETLKNTPKDASASLVYAKFLSGRDKWDKALKYFVNSADPALKETAEQDLIASPKSYETCLKVSEKWENAAKKYSPEKEKFNKRAVYWLQNAMTATDNPITKAKLEKKIKTFETNGAPKNGGGLVDLLAMIDPKKDAVAGDWALSGSSLQIPAYSRARLCIPFIPSAEYDLKVVTSKKTGNGCFNIGLIVGDTQTLLTLDAFEGAAGAGVAYGGNGNWKKLYPGKIFNNATPKSIVCSVRKDKLSVSVDGKQIIDLKQAEYENLSMDTAWSVNNSKTLFVGAHDCNYQIDQLVITPISGAGKKLRD